MIISAKGDLSEDRIRYITKNRILPYLSLSRLVRKVLFGIGKKNNYYFYPEWNLDLITLRQVTKLLDFQPDLIIVYWTKFVFNMKLINKLSNYLNVPVLVYMMDMAPITGGCHYSFNCQNFKKSCGKCPALFIPHRFDISNRNYKKKFKLIEKTNISLITASEESRLQALSSPMWGRKKIFKLLLAVDESQFYLGDRKKHKGYELIPV
jgi:hypothetical protein